MFPLETDSRAVALAVATALDAITAADGVVFSSLDVLDVLTVIRYESAGDPKAINNEDINAKEGHPSQGLMQVIPTTFAQFALPAYSTDITDPVSNIVAAVRYALRRYGSLQRIPGIVKLAAASQGQYCGY